MPRVPAPSIKIVALAGFVIGVGKTAAAGQLVEVEGQHTADGLVARGLARFPTPEELEAAPAAASDLKAKSTDQSDRRKR